MKKVTIAFKGSRPVDAHCPGAASKHVYEANGVVYDVMLNQTNIGQNNNKFYVIQLLESDAGNTYFVFTRWGRVGVSGQQSIDSFKSLDSATSAFESKFKDKTANVWANRDSFVKKSGKYDMVHIDYATEEPAAPAEPQDKKPVEIPKSTLPDAVQSFIGFIADVKTMESTMLEMEYDATKAPLGKLTAVQIKNGYESLSRIANIIKHNSGNLMEACSEFYTRIPHNFGHRTPPLIRSEADVKRKQDLLGALGDIQIAMKLFQGDANKLGNPIDNHYASLKCDLVPLSESSPDWSLVTQYMSNTHASTHNSYKLKLLHLFKACRSGEDERFRPDIGNRQLLWHGSRSTNFVGILSTGLRIAPPEAPVTGYMFGKGIYFADMVSKSANYCFATGRPTAKACFFFARWRLESPTSSNNLTALFRADFLRESTAQRALGAPIQTPQRPSRSTTVCACPSARESTRTSTRPLFCIMSTLCTTLRKSASAMCCRPNSTTAAVNERPAVVSAVQHATCAVLRTHGDCDGTILKTEIGVDSK
eukprot:Opistho-2@54117